jgi:hypothetical protein
MKMNLSDKQIEFFKKIKNLCQEYDITSISGEGGGNCEVYSPSWPGKGYLYFQVWEEHGKDEICLAATKVEREEIDQILKQKEQA